MAISTAGTDKLGSFGRGRIQQTLVLIYGLIWLWAAFAPVSRTDWLLENLLVFAAVGFLVWLYRIRPLSDVTSLMLLLFLALHTIGSHYTYSEVPVGDWLKSFLGLERNHYDRVVHFTFGLLLTYPFRELFLRVDAVKRGWAGFFTFAVIAAGSLLYEIVEWDIVEIVDPSAGMAFLGAQGDEFDSQKDSALALLGSIIALGVTAIAERSPSRTRETPPI